MYQINKLSQLKYGNGKWKWRGGYGKVLDGLGGFLGLIWLCQPRHQWHSAGNAKFQLPNTATLGAHLTHSVPTPDPGTQNPIPTKNQGGVLRECRTNKHQSYTNWKNWLRDKFGTFVTWSFEF